MRRLKPGRLREMNIYGKEMNGLPCKCSINMDMSNSV
jgi:hypothetical protein